MTARMRMEKSFGSTVENSSTRLFSPVPARPLTGSRIRLAWTPYAIDLFDPM